jgi:ferredoxin
MTFEVKIAETGECFSCGSEQSVLDGMVQLGRRGIPVGCRGGGCGVCKIEVLAGSFQSKVMSRSHISAEDERQGRVLACRIFPSSDIELCVIGKMKRAVMGEESRNG